eukprot:1155586-Pelagomonas_calceolata.AAC.1
MIIKALSKSPRGAGLVNMDIGSDDRYLLAQHNLQIPAYASNRIIPLYLFPRKFYKIFRLTSSRPDAIINTSYKAKPIPSSPSSTRSHHVLRSRHNPKQRTTRANHVRQPHQLHVNQQHVHLIEIKYCEDTRPERQLEAAQRQHADIQCSCRVCKLISAKAVTLTLIFLPMGVGGTCYTDHTLNQFKQLGLDHQRANKLAHKLHAHSVQYANKLVTTGHAIENSNASHSQVLELGASSNPPDAH